MDGAVGVVAAGGRLAGRTIPQCAKSAHPDKNVFTVGVENETCI